MRVTTELWVSAIVRRAFAAGGFAAVARKGSAEAGAVMVLLRNRRGEVELYGPAAQAIYDEANPDERRFTWIMQSAEPEEITARIERESRFDSDLWVVDLEVDDGTFAELIPTTMP